MNIVVSRFTLAWGKVLFDKGEQFTILCDNVVELHPSLEDLYLELIIKRNRLFGRENGFGDVFLLGLIAPSTEKDISGFFEETG